MLKCRVYDDRTDETLYASKNVYECINFINENFDENHEGFPHIWIESIKN